MSCDQCRYRWTHSGNEICAVNGTIPLDRTCERFKGTTQEIPVPKMGTEVIRGRFGKIEVARSWVGDDFKAQVGMRLTLLPDSLVDMEKEMGHEVLARMLGEIVLLGARDAMVGGAARS